MALSPDCAIFMVLVNFAACFAPSKAVQLSVPCQVPVASKAWAPGATSPDAPSTAVRAMATSVDRPLRVICVILLVSWTGRPVLSRYTRPGPPKDAPRERIANGRSGAANSSPRSRSHREQFAPRPVARAPRGRVRSRPAAQEDHGAMRCGRAAPGEDRA
jgi:hypothetical protein